MAPRFKPEAVWHNFTRDDFPTMALGRRLDHPSRDYFYRWLGHQALQSSPVLRWCDVGVLSMVDYVNVRRRLDPVASGRIVYTGLEIGEPIAAEARRRLLRVEDRIVMGDLEDPGLSASVTERFDALSIRHVLNHSRYYEIPLQNAFDLLAPGGKVFVNLHMKCSVDRDVLETRPMPGVTGEYIENVYEFDGFLRRFSALFAVESVAEIDWTSDARNKPNQIFVGVKAGYPRRARPETIRVSPSRLADLVGSLRRRLGSWVSPR